MSDWYFYLSKGKAVGPIGPLEVKAAIERGQIGPFDLLYRDGQERWRPSHEFGEFKGEFKERPKSRPEDTWVVLVREETRRGMAYLQRGPFSTAEIQAQLKAGEIKYRDFIWRDGQEEWSRISALEIFNPPPVKWQPATQLPQDVEIEEEVTADHLVEEVVTQTRVQLPETMTPKEAVTPDLTVVLPEAPAPRPYRPVPRSPTQPSTRLKTPRPQDNNVVAPWALGLPRRFRLARWAAMAASLGVLLFLFVHREDILKVAGVQWPGETEEPVGPAPAPPKRSKGKAVRPEMPKVAEVAPAPPPPPAPPPEPEVPKVEPTRFKVQIGGDSSRPTATFVTDASIHFPIRVTVMGEAGEVLEQVSVYREVTVRWGKNEKPRLDLFTMNLGDGKYRLQAQIGNELKDQVGFRLGRDNREFRARLDRHRKLISLPFQRERRRLIRAAVDLNRLGSELRQSLSNPEVNREALRRWRTDLNEWTRQDLGGIDLDDPKSLVFPLQWRKLREHRQTLNEWAQDAERSGKKPTSPEAVRDLVSELGQLTALSQKISLFR